MFVRLRYLLEEGFEVGNLSATDVSHHSENLGKASLTYVLIEPDGTRRLTTEEFEVTEEEAKLCSKMFLESQGNN